MSDVTIPGGKIRSFVERIENIDGELAELNEQKKEVFAEAKGEGFDVKILKEIIKLRKQDQDERDERESLLDLYMRAYAGAPLPGARLGSVAAMPIVAALEQPAEQRLRGGRVASLELEPAPGLVAGSAELDFEGSRLAVSLTVSRVDRRWLVTSFEPG